MNLSSFELPASLIKHYLYCPRIPYFILIHGVKERATELMIAGREEHKKRLKQLERRGWIVNVFLRAEKYGVYGYVDAIKKEENGYVVLEFKNTEYRKKIVKTHLYQAACYALLVEEKFGRVCKILLKYTDREVSFPFSRGVKKYCISIINKIQRIAKGELVRGRIHPEKCKNCGFFKVCREI